MTEEEERELRIALMEADLRLKQRQSFWETPKAIVLIVATTAAIMGTVAGLAGYRLGSQPPQTINVHLDAPLIAPQR
jgi:ABC-type spermidine/putrescine transport system permease subunit II